MFSGGIYTTDKRSSGGLLNEAQSVTKVVEYSSKFDKREEWDDRPGEMV